MGNRSIHFLLTVTTVLASSIFPSGMPAHAGSPDVCISILQDAAQEATSTGGVSELKLSQYPDYKGYAKTCDQVLSDAGLITVSRVRENRNAAIAVLNGETTQDSLDPAKKKQALDDLRQREARLKQLRIKICSRPTSETAYACPRKDISS